MYLNDFMTNYIKLRLNRCKEFEGMNIHRQLQLQAFKVYKWVPLNTTLHNILCFKTINYGVIKQKVKLK